MKTKKTMTQIIQSVIENGLAKTQTELENEFEFAASEDGWSDEEIKEAINSQWFPKITN